VAGVEYSVLPGYRPLLVDVHRPVGPDPVPVVLFVHGDRWQQGSRGSFGPGYAGWEPGPFERIVRAGIALVSVDYRLSGEARFPAQTHDIAGALGWLRTHAPELGLDFVLHGELAQAGRTRGTAGTRPAHHLLGVQE
jgi:acetyl esterase/lipase